MQRAVGFHRQHFRERLEERARGVGRHGLGRGLRDVLLLTVLLPFLSEHGSRRAAVRLDIPFRVASDLDAVASRRHFPEFGDEELGEVKFEAHVHDALLAVSPRDERGAMEALGDVRDDVLGPISVGAVPEEVAGDASHKEEILVHAMTVDADPLAARGDVEDAGVGESHLVLEFVHEAGHLFGELFLDVPAVRVPHRRRRGPSRSFSCRGARRRRARRATWRGRRRWRRERPYRRWRAAWRMGSLPSPDWGAWGRTPPAVASRWAARARTSP